jgi:hypothetical protein
MTTQAARLVAFSLNALLPVARLVSVPKPYDGRFSICPAGKRIASSVRTSCGVILDACVRISFDVAQAGADRDRRRCSAQSDPEICAPRSASFEEP